ncbi:oligosaccharide flippase family protein [Heliobacterium gestii]|uniref:Oligosaccharide flippase family protein n=1 Tax=Heliomicrobium gestii TaxID=2699 RepID=A0A845LMX8_HELGE|nr:lipopolysaccharide biosynthesis protein [Heliomicrobium gestii]MBM7867980.1 O-antigen/teichoic acid export membrane protein [Heliomicrobium gestii]MZP44246.1 oligosaccharide flippase family protein [Heliomicrobium gestii]
MKREWAKGAVWALLEQASFSGSNFLFGLLLARWLSPDRYGAYVLAYALFLFLAGVHNALILEPMSVLGPSRQGQQLDDYFSIQLRLHFLLTALLAVVVALSGFVLFCAWPQNPLGMVLTTSGLTLPLILYYWTLRRQLYISGKIGYAVISNGLYAGLTLVVATRVHQWGLLTPETAFLIMGAAGTVAGCIPIPGRGRWWNGLTPWADMKRTLQANWMFGRWLLGASLLALGSTQAQTLLLGWWAGAEAAGILQAMMNFMLPMTQTVTAASTWMLPVFARDFGEGKLAQLRSNSLVMMVLLTACALAYWLLLWGGGDLLERLIYGGRYVGYVWLIPIIGLVPVITAAAAVYSVTLRAFQRPDLHFATIALQAVTGLLTALWMIPQWRVAGAAYSIVATYLMAGWMTYMMYRKALAGLDEKNVSERTE